MGKGLDMMAHLPSHHHHPWLPTISRAPLSISPSPHYCLLVACESTSAEWVK